MMILTEIDSFSTASITASLVLKLIKNKVPIHISTVDWQGKTMVGRVTSTRLGESSKEGNIALFIKFLEKHDSGYDVREDTVYVKHSELERSTLKKQSDGSYLFTFPNLEYEAAASKRKKEKL